MQISKVIYIAFLVFLAYFIMQFIYCMILVLIALFEEEKRTKQRQAEDYARFHVSIFTLPVSVIIPAHNEEEWVLDSIKAVLSQDYPEFEIIVVEDGSTDNTFTALDNFLKLKSLDRTYIEYFTVGKILEVFQSEKYPNVTVVKKAGGFKKAGALNAGLNFAKYKYVCVIDADTLVEPDALLKVMAHVEKDPDNTIGIGSYFGLANGLKIKDGKIIKRSYSRNPIVAYQNLEYIRSLAINRIAWSKFNALPIVAGGFGIWRRDILLKLGGYASEFSSEDVEFTFRAHDYMIEKKDKGYKIVMLPYFVGWTEGPSNIFSFVMQRNRWQRVINETLWKYKHMIFSPKHGVFAFFTLPYLLLYESLGVFFELTGICLVIFGAITRALDFKIFLVYFIFMILANAIISLLSLFIFVRNQKIFRPNDVVYFIVLSFFEFFWYRWLMTFAKLLGTLGWFKGERTFDQYTRLKR